MLDFNHILATPGVDIQTFFSPTTINTEWRVWNKPRNISWVHIICVGGGSSGAGGTFTGASAASTGAVGGGSGAQSMVMLPAMFVPSQLFMQIGLGGRQGTAITSALSSVSGTLSYVAIEPTSTAQLVLLYANGGQIAGIGGAVSAMSGNFALAGRGWSSNFAGQSGGAAGATQNGAGGAITLPTTGLMVTGGAGSGGKDVTAATRGAGGAVNGTSQSTLLPALAGGVAAATGVNAGDGSSGGMFKPWFFLGGSGGGAGGFAASGTGADGGAGGNGGPGCGGGASGPGYSTTGRAGDGGDGFVIIASW